MIPHGIPKVVKSLRISKPTYLVLSSSVQGHTRSITCDSFVHKCSHALTFDLQHRSLTPVKSLRLYILGQETLDSFFDV